MVEALAMEAGSRRCGGFPFSTPESTRDLLVKPFGGRLSITFSALAGLEGKTPTGAEIEARSPEVAAEKVGEVVEWEVEDKEGEVEMGLEAG